jgi:hypothetical protein
LTNIDRRADARRRNHQNGIRGVANEECRRIKRLRDWAEKAFKKAVVLPVSICVPIEFEFTLQSIGLFDALPAWNEATVGTFEERKAKLADPARRPPLRADMNRGRLASRVEVEKRSGDVEAGQISMFRWNETFIDEVYLEKNKHLERPHGRRGGQRVGQTPGRRSPRPGG